MAARDAGLLQWNTSTHDPYWRGWLTSREQFDTIRQAAPRVGTPVHKVFGGTVFEYRAYDHTRLHVWLAPLGVVVAYAPEWRWGPPDSGGGPHEFEGWIGHLAGSYPLELGLVRGRSSYGALSPPDVHSLPAIKWAQAGDWGSVARGWFVGDRQRAPWP